ncbi:MAG: hypothetical protein ISS10_02780 [Candidatus Marinimicrobia bacterium]|nr:hypothetical protein [Candidatus Neomarinimicrobiota bacterium]
MNKIQIGGILEVRGLTMIKVLGIPNQPGYGGKLLTMLGDANINLQFVAESEDMSSRANLTLCIAATQTKLALKLIENVKKNNGIGQINATTNVTALTVYGPHFREKPAICGRMCAALGNAKINILGISTSISSICCLIDDQKYLAAKNALLEVFKLP